MARRDNKNVNYTGLTSNIQPAVSKTMSYGQASPPGAPGSSGVQDILINIELTLNVPCLPGTFYLKQSQSE